MSYRLKQIVTSLTVVTFCLAFSAILHAGNFQGDGGNSSEVNTTVNNETELLSDTGTSSPSTTVLDQNSSTSNSSDTQSSTSNSSEAESPTSNSSDTQSSTVKMTMEDALAKAESEIKQPPVVYNVTDPALVYSELRPYVDQWRDSLPVPTNKWGVDTSSSVIVSSSRPDFVPAKLISFIMSALAKDGKAAALGLDGAATARKDLED